MQPDAAPEDWASVLRGGMSLALIQPSLSGPASLPRVTQDDVYSRATVHVGGAPYEVLVLESTFSGSTIPFTLEDPKAVLLGAAIVLEFLHSMASGRALVHGNLHIDAISRVGNTVIVSGFEHCGVHPVLPGAAESPDGNTGDWLHAPPGNILSMAQELIGGGTRTTATDVYAFGMLMYRVYAGKYPFAEVKSRYGVAATARLGSGQRPAREDILHPHFTDELWALMTACWAHEPSSRPTMADVRARLAQMV